MSMEILKKFDRTPTRKILFISLSVLALLLITASVQIISMVLRNEKVYKGVTVNNVSVAGITKDELIEKLNRDYNEKSQGLSINIKLGESDKTVTLKYSDAKVEYDIKKAADKAYSIGRTGNIFKRIADIVKYSSKGYNITLDCSYDKSVLQNIVDKCYDMSYVPVKESQLVIGENKVEIVTGHHGESIDKQKLYNTLESMIKNMQDGTVNVDIQKTLPAAIDVDDYYKKICREAKDAYVTVVNNNINIVPEQQGINIDKATLKQIIEELKDSEDTVRELPVQFIKPNRLTSDIQGKILKDKLASFTTAFDTSNENNANRGENIRLACQKINGKILGPGETFSFNEVVGPRTVESGYKVAHAYSNGQIVDEVGGGVCQVSTTLYNAVIRADLKVTERVNHMFTVGYVDLGMDAAVSYGGVDLKFVNNTEWPIKIEGWVQNNQITFTLIGTNTNPGKTVQFYSPEAKVIETPVQYIDDPSLPSGQMYVEKEGAPGYSVNTYKIVKQDGVVVSEELLNSSYYQPIARVIRRGIG